MSENTRTVESVNAEAAEAEDEPLSQEVIELVFKDKNNWLWGTQVLL